CVNGFTALSYNWFDVW
nr:immunoglobulin heavy chain junction region [Macaca mulatta]MOX14923.1 immunoglobulin heavy chain junction region [Macaca mulatta]MOX15211.1 immunoglobulin heavy chain junction region [Macaca mulatta]MOX15250.1 immunoglobulin heavy chain junction region [Macaca mulatta]MOX15450.1 immunoglobulin heavy chain junction region [Macaca mulatta]